MGLDAEAARLSGMITDMESVRDPSIPDIVSTYHQVMSVTAMASAQRQTDPGSAERVGEILDNIDSRFNAAVHPRMVAYLTRLVSDATDRLRSDPGSGSYEDLREMMSTKEFVDQYGKGLR